MKRPKTHQIIAGIMAAAIAVLVSGCEDDQPPAQPDSLEAPVQMAVADGEVCLPDIVRDDGTIGVDALPSCADGGNGFGLVANQRSGRVAVVALGQDNHRLANLDSRRPGVTHIPVGQRPSDLTTSGDATAAMVANQADETLTGIDLWTMRPLEETVDIEGTPRAIEAYENDDGQVVRALLTTGPDRLELGAGLRCERPETTDRRDHNPSQNCDWSDIESDAIDLDGRPVDMAVDEDQRRAWVVYRDLNEVSWIALDEEGLDGDECQVAGQTPPCEIDSVQWEQPEAAVPNDRWGATAVDIDPLGQFVYALDRPNNRLFVFDRQRRSLIDASQAIEPPAPADDGAGISLVRSPMAFGAESQREIIDDGHIRYRQGVRVAANNGQLYRVGTADVECVFDGEASLDDSTFFFDADARGDSDEASCLELPEFPRGGDPDFDTDDELLERRVVESDDGDTTLAVTPMFGLRDRSDQQGQIVGRTQCEQPQAFRDALRDVEDGEGLDCDSTLSPQPLASGVDDDLDSFADAPPANLMEFAFALFDDDRQPIVERSTFDRRLTNERWFVSYEGALPGGSDAGLVSDDGDGAFSSGSSEFCSDAVEAGDRLTITSSPTGDECGAFESEDAEFRTWEIADVGPDELQLEVLGDDDRADELPTRDCFGEGVSYEVRPDDQWVVVGTQTGVVSPYEADGDECVLRDGADDERSRLQSRVETGGQYVGPYLRFELHEGEVDPIRGLEYNFQVERNFALDARRHVAEGGGPTLPSQVLMTPDLGNGRLVTVVDGGGNRIFVANLTDPGLSAQRVR